MKKTYPNGYIRTKTGLPISVIVPHTVGRTDFFRNYCYPSIAANGPSEIIVDTGLGTAPVKRNRGAKQATQPFLFFCDDDIVLSRKCLSSLHRAIGENAFSYCGYHGVVMNNGVHPSGKNFTLKAKPFSINAMRNMNIASTMSLLRRDKFPGFDESLYRYQDWDLWLTIIEEGGIGVAVPEELFMAFYLDAGISSQNKNRKMLINVIKQKHSIKTHKRVHDMMITKNLTIPYERIKGNVHTMMPYSEDKNLAKAYNRAMELLNDDDWAIFLDHDAMWLTPGWYSHIIETISRYPDGGLFTAITNRIGNKAQLWKGLHTDNHDIKSHREIASRLEKHKRCVCVDLTNDTRISGVVMITSKAAWKKCGGFRHGSKSKILGVDNLYHTDIANSKQKVYMMSGLYVYHWYRGDGSRKHLK